MKRKYVGYVIIYLILATITLTASVFAWFQISKNSSGFIETNIPDFTNMINFYVTREDGIERLVETIDDMHEVFGDTKPGEFYEFRMTINNKFKSDFNFNIYIPDIHTTKVSAEDLASLTQTEILALDSLSMLDIFYINDGIVTTRVLPENIIVEHQINESLSEYYLSNLIDDQNNLFLLKNFKVSENTEVEIKFTLTYDINTENTLYQYLILNLGGIYVYAEAEQG